MSKKRPHQTDDLGEMDAFEHSKALSESDAKALGIPSVADAKAYLAKKELKESRINIRLTHKTLNGLKARAQEIGIPYQTLVASVLHQVAMGKLKMSLRTA